jgi:hypothetical protein
VDASSAAGGLLGHVFFETFNLPEEPEQQGQGAQASKSDQRV